MKTLSSFVGDLFGKMGAPARHALAPFSRNPLTASAQTRNCYFRAKTIPNYLIISFAAASIFYSTPNQPAYAEEVFSAPQKKVAAAPHAALDAAAIEKEDAESRRLFQAISQLLADTATQRVDANKLPSESDFIVPPIWRETRERRMESVQELLDAALDVVTDVPLVEIQKRLDASRGNISSLEDQITALREKRLSAPDDALLPGILSDTVSSIDDEISDLKKRIKGNEAEIEKAKGEIQAALQRSGLMVTADQVDLLLGSVVGGDMIKMVAAYQAARKIDQRLSSLMDDADGEIKTSRRYFAMHAALYAMLLHAQSHVIEKIDQVYLKRMETILNDIKKARADTRKLLREKNRDDQIRVLSANLKEQAFSERVALFYRDYLKTQRAQMIRARAQTRRDLRIADNTFSTVEASFQLRALIDDAKSSFEAMQMLEAPGFDQVFKNEELRREFENLTEKLTPPSS